jgi:hypothetical protein
MVIVVVDMVPLSKQDTVVVSNVFALAGVEHDTIREVEKRTARTYGKYTVKYCREKQQTAWEYGGDERSGDRGISNVLSASARSNKSNQQNASSR